MRDDVTFKGPLASATTADEYRQICKSFAEEVRSLSIVSIAGDDDTIHVVYRIDMGLSEGPLLTSQTAVFVDGQFASVEVIFDAAMDLGAAA